MTDSRGITGTTSPLFTVFLFVVLFVVFGAIQAPGAENGAQLPAISPEDLGYSVTHWTVEDGLPDRINTSLAQTSDGYLWCGSPGGLVRYEGSQFRVEEIYR
jgi:hypothetical protein